ncbi:hypothetical protein FKM82_019470 [Ascaphus truei]
MQISEGKVSPPQWNTDEDDDRKTNLADMIASSSVSFQNYQSHANLDPPGQRDISGVLSEIILKRLCFKNKKERNVKIEIMCMAQAI